MNFIIYNKVTTKYLRVRRGKYWRDAIFASEGAAKTALNRYTKEFPEEDGNWKIDGMEYFTKNIEKTEVVRSAMDGAKVTQSVNTPWACSVASEAYWSN